MQVKAVISRVAALGLRACRALSFVAPLATRIALGNAFFLTGRGKLAHFDDFVSYMTDLGVPAPALNAAFVARVEYYGAILLLLGLLTRIAAALLASTMVVALLTAERASFLTSWSPTGDVGPLDIAPFVFLLLLTWLVLYGPGGVSLDWLLARGLGLGRAPDTPRAEGSPVPPA